MLKLLSTNHIWTEIYSYDNTYEIFFKKYILIDLKVKMYKLKVFINKKTNNILILVKDKIFIHCDKLEEPTFVSTCVFNNKFPKFEKNKKKIIGYPEFIFQEKIKNKNNIIKFIENKYSKTFHPFIEIFF